MALECLGKSQNALAAEIRFITHLNYKLMKNYFILINWDFVRNLYRIHPSKMDRDSIQNSNMSVPIFSIQVNSGRMFVSNIGRAGQTLPVGYGPYGGPWSLCVSVLEF